MPINKTIHKFGTTFTDIGRYHIRKKEDGRTIGARRVYVDEEGRECYFTQHAKATVFLDMEDLYRSEER